MKILRNITVFITIIFLVWCGLSYFEVISQNTTPTPTILSEWNFFKIISLFF